VSTTRSPLVEQLEDLMLPGQRRATIARFASRFFVLVGPRNAAPEQRDVQGPYDTRMEASRRARILQQHSYEEAAQ
jgi:hypothetical protein